VDEMILDAASSHFVQNCATNILMIINTMRADTIACGMTDHSTFPDCRFADCLTDKTEASTISGRDLVRGVDD
jgi:hypothetical protein